MIKNTWNYEPSRKQLEWALTELLKNTQSILNGKGMDERVSEAISKIGKMKTKEEKYAQCVEAARIYCVNLNMMNALEYASDNLGL